MPTLATAWRRGPPKAREAVRHSTRTGLADRLQPATTVGDGAHVLRRSGLLTASEAADERVDPFDGLWHDAGGIVTVPVDSCEQQEGLKGKLLRRL